MRGWQPGQPYLIGYSHRLSTRPGETVDVRVSTQLPGFTADLVRLRHGDENPDGPGFSESRVDEVATLNVPGRVQSTPLGSSIRIPPGRIFDVSPVALTIWFRPSLLDREQCLVSWLDPAGRGPELGLSSEGGLCLQFGGNDSRIDFPALQLGMWHLIGFTMEASRMSLAVKTKPNSPVEPTDFVASSRVTLTGWDVGLAPLVVGGRDRSTVRTEDEVERVGTLFGRVADPALWHGKAGDRLDALWAGERPDPADPDLIAFWDLGADPGSDLCRDIGTHSHHGHLLNGGTRLVTGPHFEDSNTEPTSMTHSAIHLHGDEVFDAGWESDFALRLPDSIGSGVYAIRLGAPEGDVYDHVPLFVRGHGEHRMAVIFPTNTYLAYGNERMNFGTIELPAAERSERMQPVDRFIEASQWLGASLYDEHVDRSGVTRVSRHRPIVTMRPEHRSWLSGDPRHLSADLYLVDWLEHHDYGFDVLTDEDLHREGLSSLEPYQVVITGSHPEYVTGEMLDALHEYTNQGGRLMYLGGNGFYWVTTMHPERHDVIEVRRGFAGSRTWESAPGDDRHSTTGEIGGLWRHRGRSPNQLVGVGFAASGWGGSAGAFRVIRPIDERASFVFDGVDVEQPIGNHGLIMNGCVGDEVDRWDPDRGSPIEAIRLATCTELNDSYLVVVEDTIGSGTDITSSTNPRVRADTVLLPTGNGGAVFSAGTMAWLGSLSHENYDNAVSRITRNVLSRFLTDGPI